MGPWAREVAPLHEFNVILLLHARPGREPGAGAGERSLLADRGVFE